MGRKNNNYRWCWQIESSKILFKLIVSVKVNEINYYNDIKPERHKKGIDSTPVFWIPTTTHDLK